MTKLEARLDQQDSEHKTLFSFDKYFLRLVSLRVKMILGGSRGVGSTRSGSLSSADPSSLIDFNPLKKIGLNFSCSSVNVFGAEVPLFRIHVQEQSDSTVNGISASYRCEHMMGGTWDPGLSSCRRRQIVQRVCLLVRRDDKSGEWKLSQK
eukprot:TRINITY_DN7933_c0_g1_i2.p1 TRINITY_DN7933_c0_g1~~TRINITY_DN7933_c0_g1_i2.p1  ORF type:complete len:151 (+),score=20.60 TRINITY_DN7933_c0_g1_i2:246-698(+)